MLELSINIRAVYIALTSQLSLSLPLGGYMSTRLLFLSAPALIVLVSLYAAAQPPGKATRSSAGSPVPEMARLATALVGDWNTAETMERTQFFPNGGSRRGVVHVRLAAEGTVLIYEVNSNGPAGKLDGFLTIWWDEPARIFHFFTCFNNPKNPCRMRGTGHWDADTFINDYEETVDGRKTEWRDSFTFTPTSHTLIAAMATRTGALKTIVTTRATRR